MLIEEICPDRHFEGVEWIFESKVLIEFVNFGQKLVDAHLLRIADHQELDPGDGLHAVQLERVSLLRKQHKS